MENSSSSKRSFCRWRCVFQPRSASDPRISLPYAVLELSVYRARDLAASDWNGLADPYVEVHLNDSVTGCKTKTQNSTRAPEWEEQFKVEIFHPASILSLVLWDEDMYGRKRLGHVDIDLARLPASLTGVTNLGWCDVLAPSAWADSALDRLAYHASSDKSVEHQGRDTQGQIQLGINLLVRHPLDELFANCIGLPISGEQSIRLNLNAWFSDIGFLFTSASCLVDLNSIAVVQQFGRLLDMCHRDRAGISIGICALAVFFIWNMEIILPLFVAVAALVSYPKRDVSVLGNMVDRPETSPAQECKAGRPVPKKSRAELAIDMLPKRKKEIVLSAMGILAKVREFVKSTSNTWNAMHTYGSVVGFGSLSVVLFVFRHWQVFALRCAFTCIVLAVLVRISLSRVFCGIYAYLERKWQQQEMLSHEASVQCQDSSEEEQFVISRRSHGTKKMTRQLTRRGTKKLTRQLSLCKQRQLTRRITKKMTLRHQASVEEEDARSKARTPHAFVAADFLIPVWCEYCGRVLLGFSEQGYFCENCRCILCPRCADVDAHNEDDPRCPGAHETRSCDWWFLVRTADKGFANHRTDASTMLSHRTERTAKLES